MDNQTDGARCGAVIDLEMARISARILLYSLALNIIEASDNQRLIGKYQAGVSNMSMITAQKLVLMLDGMSYDEAAELAVKRVGRTVENMRPYADQIVQEWEHQTAIEMFRSMTLDDLVDQLRQKANLDLTADEIIQTYNSSPHDKARQRLMEYLPGNPDDIERVFARWLPPR